MEFAVYVRVEVVDPLGGGVAGLGLKLILTPAGRPVAVRVTGELKLFADDSVIVDWTEPPWTRVSETGRTARSKVGGGVTTSVTFRALTRTPLVPVTVMVKVPVAAPAPAASVSTDEPGVVTGFAEKEAVRPPPKPVVLKTTGELNPLIDSTETETSFEDP